MKDVAWELEQMEWNRVACNVVEWMERWFGHLEWNKSVKKE